MKNLTLERFAYSEFGTFGKMQVNGVTLYTVERPWLDNQPSVSCIPTGHYTLEPHSSDKYPNTWALVGDTVSHYPSGKPRSAILIHAGNTMHDLQGCIAPGLRLGALGGVWAVLESKLALIELRKHDIGSINIVNYHGGNL